MDKSEKKSGGARKGAGRKKKEPTQVISFRVKKKHIATAKEQIQPIVDKINKK